jgi:hypothetical protein
MTDKKPVYDDASKVDAEEGAVKVEGPDEVDVKLTPEAAAETSDRLLRGAFKAGGQKRMEGNPHKAKD